MSRVIPQISSGDDKLLISETVCFNPANGLLIEVPTKPRKFSDNVNIYFNFTFPIQKDMENGTIETKIIDNKINITIYNFGSSLLSGLIKPLKFTIGNISISLFFTGMVLNGRALDEDKLLQFTFSVFSGEIG